MKKIDAVGVGTWEKWNWGYEIIDVEPGFYLNY
jgi:hypothetical protein